jgi:hypothetical protein
MHMTGELFTATTLIRVSKDKLFPLFTNKMAP